MKNEKTVEEVQEVELTQNEIEAKESSSVVSFAMGITAFFCQGWLIQLIFSIIALVFVGKSKKVEKPVYRSFHSVGKILGVTSLIKAIINLVLPYVIYFTVFAVIAVIAVFAVIVVAAVLGLSSLAAGSALFLF